MTWKKTNKIGRGAMQCYVFYVENSYGEYEKYLKEKEDKR